MLTMSPGVSPAAATAVTVRIDLGRIRQQAVEIAQRTRVDVLAVVKADAYNLGASRVAQALAPAVAGFCVFSLSEAIEANLGATGRPSLALGPPQTLDPRLWIAHRCRPCVTTVEQATALHAARPIVCVDTGMQRFACPPDQLDAVIRAGQCDEALTHATRLEHVERLRELIGDRPLKLHAAATALLSEPAAWLNAVRPGLALYRGAVRVSTRLMEARDARGPAGYTGFVTQRFGVIPCGYALGLRRGVCSVHHRPMKILEVGMQSAFVELPPDAHVGDEVVLLGDAVDEATLAEQWQATPHEILIRLAAAGQGEYIGA